MRPRSLSALAVLALLLPATGHACPALPPVLTVTVREQPAPAPPLPAHAAGHYRGTIATTYALTATSGPRCARPARLAVTLTLIHAATIAPAHRGTCRAAVIADHEAAHADADRQLIEQEAGRIRRDMGFLLSVPFRTPAEIEDAAAAYFTASAARLAAERQRLQSAIDSPASYEIATRQALRCTAAAF